MDARIVVASCLACLLIRARTTSSALACVLTVVCIRSRSSPWKPLNTPSPDVCWDSASSVTEGRLTDRRCSRDSAANKWKTDQGEGWELYVDGVGVTQVDHLEEAEAQVRDLIETMTDSSAANVRVEILVEGQVR